MRIAGRGVGRGVERLQPLVRGIRPLAARAEEAERIINWAFRQFVLKTVAKAGVRVAEAPG